MRTSALSTGFLRSILLPAVLSGLIAAPLHAQVGAALDQAEAWLVGAQNADGSFGTVARLAPRDSALSVLALNGAAGAESAVTQGAVYLQGVPEANTHFRSRRALALAATGRSFQPLLDALFDFRNGGGMGAFGEHQSTLLDTSLAIEALTLEEGARLLDIASLLDYLQLHQGVDGGWGFVAGAPSDVYFTAEALRSLAGLRQLVVGEAVVDGAASFLLGRQLPARAGSLVAAVSSSVLAAPSGRPGQLPLSS